MVRSRHAQAGGSKMFEFVVVLALLGILSMVALEYMLHYIEASEKSAVETTTMYLRSALRLRLAEVIADNDIDEVKSLARDNPMDWLREKPHNYAGTFGSPQPGTIAPGKWYFDTDSRELVYLVEYGREFVPDKSGLKQVRLRINAPALEMVLKENRRLYVNEIVRDISLDLVAPYNWEFK